ncbi:hypothetical protein JW887_03720 [Candidatus Dojkabacteria bacterium]|nr:hypothetical protein [Candidatus Dojkabacteria bacterium]
MADIKEAPKAAPTNTTNSKPADIWLGFGIISVFLGVIVLIMNIYNASIIKKYQDQGVETTGIVYNGGYTKEVGKSTRKDFWLEVSFYTEDDEYIVDGKIDELLSSTQYDNADIGEEVDIVYLADDPKESVVLKDSVDKDNVGSFGTTYLVPIVIFGIGLAFFGVFGVMKFMKKDQK